MAIVIFGAGGLGREVLAVLRAAGHEVAGFLVEHGHATAPVHDVPVHDDLTKWRTEADTRFVLAVGDSRERARVAGTLEGARFAGAVHPVVTLGPHVSLGQGVMILGPVNATTDVELGSHVLLNPGCILSHDCQIGDFASLGPGVLLAGRVTIEEGAQLGVGAVVAPRCRIGAWATVGAGAVVVRDVEPGITVIGVPARPVVRNSEN